MVIIPTLEVYIVRVETLVVGSCVFGTFSVKLFDLKQ